MTILGEKALVECDGCGVVVDMPEGNAEWVVLVYALGQLRPPMDFCSEQCLEWYLKEQRFFNADN